MSNAPRGLILLSRHLAQRQDNYSAGTIFKIWDDNVDNYVR